MKRIPRPINKNEEIRSVWRVKSKIAWSSGFLLSCEEAANAGVKIERISSKARVVIFASCGRYYRGKR